MAFSLPEEDHRLLQMDANSAEQAIEARALEHKTTFKGEVNSGGSGNGTVDGWQRPQPKKPAAIERKRLVWGMVDAQWKMANHRFPPPRTTWLFAIR